MSKYLVEDATMVNIGNSIRGVLNATNTYTPSNMANTISSRMLGVPDPIVAGDYPIYGITTSEKFEDSSYTDLGVYQFMANRAGTYRFKWCCMKAAIGSSSGNSTALYLNDVQQYENSSFSNNTNYNEVDVAMDIGDVVSIRAKHSGLYATYIYGVNVCIDWDGANAFFV